MNRSLTRRSGVCAMLGAILAACIAAVAGAAEPSAAPLPTAIEKIVLRFVADSSGISLSRETIVYEQKAPGNNEHDEQDFSIIQQDRKTLAIRLHRVVEKGKLDSPDVLAKAQAQLDEKYAKELPRVVTRFSLPIYPESAGDYTFSTPTPCAACGNGAESIEFKSTINDERHGHGTLAFDPAASRALKLEFTPNVPPKPASAAKVTYTFGRHDDGGWGAVRVDEHYSGRVLLISGTLDRTSTLLHSRRYATLDEARRALQAE